MGRFVRGVRFLSQLLGYFAATLIAVSVFVVCHMVFVRYVLGENTIWQTDFATYGLVAATFIGSPYVLMWRVRLWIPYSSLPIGLGVLTLQCLADLVGLISGREPPFGLTKGHRA